MDVSFSNDYDYLMDNHKTLSVKVYDMILNLIIEGKLKVDERINSDLIAKSFSVSRTPVREALKSLEKTGLVHFKSYSGAYVKKLTVEEIEEIYSIRKILESFALKEAIDNVCENDISRLYKIQNKIEVLIENEPVDVKKVYDLNALFHMTLYKISKMPKLCEMIETLWINLSLYRFLLASKESYSDTIKTEHQDYIDCLKNKDKDKIISIIQRNLDNHLKKVPALVNDYYLSLEKGTVLL